MAKLPFLSERALTERFRIEPQTTESARERREHTRNSGSADHAWPLDSMAPESSPVYDLLGTSGQVHSSERSPRTDDSSNDVGDPLISALFEQYCQALDAPLLPRAYDWVGAAAADESLLPELGERGGRWHDTSSSPVAAVLGDINTVEQAFGALQPSDSREVVRSEGTPEVLRLFAPPEHQLALSRRANTPPPTLARREHHALAIDSPIRPLDAAHGIEQGTD